MQLVDTLKMWKENCEKLLNEEKLWDNTLELKQNIEPVEEITVEELRRAMSKMKKDSAVEPSGVPMEAIQLCYVESTLAEFANDMMYGKRMPSSWRKSILISLHKRKGDTKQCTSYRRLKMLEHAMKIVKRVFWGENPKDSCD